MSADCRPIRVKGAKGVWLVGDDFGHHDDPAVALFHGAGQTRHSWRDTARILAARGFRVVSFDLRGHGDSDWSPAGDYSLDSFRDDVGAVVKALGQPCALVGASLGGLASLLHVAECPADDITAMILVDIAPNVDPDGARRIMAFMAANEDGFVSLEEAGAAVSRYLPNREKPSNLQGLMKNLRQRDGRLYWHWDPAFPKDAKARIAVMGSRLLDARQTVKPPTLLIRGAESELIGAREAQELQQLIEHAEVVVIDGARHMVGGDQNTMFGSAVVNFLERTVTRSGGLHARS